MLIQKNNLCLNHIKVDTNTLPVADGLVISVKDASYETGYIDIAYIYWNADNNDCYIQTIEDRFQTYVVLYDTFVDFIYLVDEAFRMVSLVHNQTPLKY